MIDGENGQAPRILEAGSSSNSGDPPNEEGNDSDSETAIVQNLLSPNQGHSYSSPHSAPLALEMEQILTEDGEPMLNPGLSCLSFSSVVCPLTIHTLAELLTQVSMINTTPTVLDLMLQILGQESLASPPPS